jgi:hypothetical protein
VTGNPASTSSVAEVADVAHFCKQSAALYAEIEEYLNRFVVYPTEHARLAHVLWVVHSWLMDQWDNTPRLAFLSPEPGSGKTRALEVTEPLVPRPCHSVTSTAAYLLRKVSDPDGRPTILYDEIDTVFGPKAKGNEELRGLINAGHRRGATAGRCNTAGAAVTTEELPAYCAVAVAGLSDLPDTIMSRAIVIRMRRRAGDERVQPWRDRINRPEAQSLGRRIAEWSDSARHFIEYPDMPNGVQDRAADVWEPILAVADLAGEPWATRAREAAQAFVAAAKQGTPSLGNQLLRDLKEVFGVNTSLWTTDIIEKLVGMPESQWRYYHYDGRHVGDRDLSKLLKPYGISPRDIRRGGTVRKGYTADDLADAWNRYVPSCATSATTATEQAGPAEVVAESSPVTDGTV